MYLYRNGKYATLVEEEQYPKIMWCWDDDVKEAVERFVLCKIKDAFLTTFPDYEKGLMNLKNVLHINVCDYKNASLTKPVKDYTRKQALKEFNINIID
jgi:hypothetical protein